MGVWGMGSFENDDALDFLGALVHGGGPELVLETLMEVVNAPADAPLAKEPAARAIAAAEMVAAGRGKACDGFPADGGAWLGRHTMAAASLRDMALQALERIVRASALRAHWDQQDPADAKAWRASLADLEKRLG